MTISRGAKKRIPILLSFLLVSILVLSGCGCKTPSANYQVNLEVWGLFDDSDVMAKAINGYKKRNKLVKEINYKKLTVDSYENDLRDALASGTDLTYF